MKVELVTSKAKKQRYNLCQGRHCRTVDHVRCPADNSCDAVKGDLVGPALVKPEVEIVHGSWLETGTELQGEHRAVSQEVDNPLLRF